MVLGVLGVLLIMVIVYSVTASQVNSRKSSVAKAKTEIETGKSEEAMLAAVRRLPEGQGDSRELGQAARLEPSRLGARHAGALVPAPRGHIHHFDGRLRSPRFGERRARWRDQREGGGGADAAAAAASPIAPSGRMRQAPGRRRGAHGSTAPPPWGNGRPAHRVRPGRPRRGAARAGRAARRRLEGSTSSTSSSDCSGREFKFDVQVKLSAPGPTAAAAQLRAPASQGGGQ